MPTLQVKFPRKELMSIAIWLQAGLMAAALSSQGCGMGTDPTGSTTAALVTAGLPSCDASLLHPHIEVANSAALPGQTIVYVDGVMACVDDAAKVDQMVGQIEGKSHDSAPEVPTGVVNVANVGDDAGDAPRR
jgi:hypothetical protein